MIKKGVRFLSIQRLLPSEFFELIGCYLWKGSTGHLSD